MVCRACPGGANSREAAQLAGLAMVVASAFVFDEGTIFPGVAALIPCLGTAFVIWGGAQTFTSKLLVNPVSRQLSLISYSMYLVHWPLIVFYKQWKIADIDATDTALLFLATVLLAELLCRFIEIPFWKKKVFGQGTQESFGLACALLVLTVSLPMANSWASGGWSWRYEGLGFSSAFDLQRLQMETVDYADSNLASAVFGGGPHRIVVIGDSHARDVSNGLHQALDNPPHDVQWQHFSAECLRELPLNEAKPNQGCLAQWNRLVRSSKISGAHLVVLSFRWPADADLKVVELIELIRSVSRTPEYQVLVLGPTLNLPNFHSTARRMLSEGASIRQINATTPSMGYWRGLDAKIKGVALTNPNAHFESKLDLMCPGGECSLISEGGELYFWDQQHWTLFGAKEYAKRLVAARPDLFKD